MTERTIQISFLITHYNRPNDLLKCLEGIKKLQLQSYEIVVCDDASEPENLKQLHDYPIDKLIVSETNLGLAANINRGLIACEGAFILYCQEDFVLDTRLNSILEECKTLIQSQIVDMVRFTSNAVFNKLIPISATISRIPKFSFHNFLLNYYQYSDHPFITTKRFYDSYGYYLENTSGRYGETEYAIRILKSKAKIGITNETLASTIAGSQSVLVNESIKAKKKYVTNKSIMRFARAFRLYFECVFYSKTKRGLLTYTNFRNK